MVKTYGLTHLALAVRDVERSLRAKGLWALGGSGPVPDIELGSTESLKEERASQANQVVRGVLGVSRSVS